MAEPILFVLMGAGVITGAVTVVSSRNPVYSAMGLLGTLFSVAVLYVVQLAHLVAAVQVIVYAGAILTLFLFVIMLIGVDRTETLNEHLPRHRLLVGGAGGVMVVFAVGLTLAGDFEWIPAATGAPADATNGTIQAVARPLFTTWLLAFEATALLLTIAAAGAIALAHHRRRSR